MPSSRPSLLRVTTPRRVVAPSTSSRQSGGVSGSTTTCGWPNPGSRSSALMVRGPARCANARGSAGPRGVRPGSSCACSARWFATLPKRMERSTRSVRRSAPSHCSRWTRFARSSSRKSTWDASSDPGSRCVSVPCRSSRGCCATSPRPERCALATGRHWTLNPSRCTRRCSRPPASRSCFRRPSWRVSTTSTVERVRSCRSSWPSRTSGPATCSRSSPRRQGSSRSMTSAIEGSSTSPVGSRPTSALTRPCARRCTHHGGGEGGSRSSRPSSMCTTRSRSIRCSSARRSTTATCAPPISS